MGVGRLEGGSKGGVGEGGGGGAGVCWRRWGGGGGGASAVEGGLGLEVVVQCGAVRYGL